MGYSSAHGPTVRPMISRPSTAESRCLIEMLLLLLACCCRFWRHLLMNWQQNVEVTLRPVQLNILACMSLQYGPIPWTCTADSRSGADSLFVFCVPDAEVALDGDTHDGTHIMP